MKDKEDKEKSRYYQLISKLKIISNLNEERDTKYSSISSNIENTNVNSINNNEELKNENIINNNISSIKNKIEKSISTNNTTKNKENLNYKSLYYYNPFPYIKNPILFISIISFHHKKGSIIETSYPTREDLILNKENNDYIRYLIKSKNNKTVQQFIDELFSKLTYICMPDGVHSTTHDTQFFIIKDYDYPLFGISCYEQIKSFRDNTTENTRHFIQKSICIISTLPLYSQLFSKLSMTVEAYFNQKNMQDKKIISELYSNFIFDNLTNFDINEITFIFASRKLICLLKEKIFVLLKMILLEKKILVFSQISGNVCSFIFNTLSLLPGQLLFNLRSGKNLTYYLKYLQMFGFPLKIFNDNYQLFPLVSLFEIDEIEKKYSKYLIGTTNQLIYNDALNKKNFELIINIDTGKIYNNDKNKDIYEESKNEKNIYNNMHKKLHELKIKYETTQWLNTLNSTSIKEKVIDKDDIKKYNYDNSVINDINKIEENDLSILNNDNLNSYDSIDDFIRNEFKKYFQEIFINLSLCINIIKNNSIVRELDIEKETKMFQYILDEKTIKKIFKIIIPSGHLIEFLVLYLNTTSFNYWLEEHDEKLFYLSNQIICQKQITYFFEDGNIYIGQFKHGLPEGIGSLSSPDNKYLYDGEWKNGLKHGMGKLVISDDIKYSGPFENDYYSGSGGILCDSNGNIYEGDFEEGKFSGYGRYKLANGCHYLGQFKDGLYNGKGQLVDEQGNIFDGEFVNGKKEGNGLLLKANGEKIEGIFKNDEFISIK